VAGYTFTDASRERMSVNRTKRYSSTEERAKHGKLNSQQVVEIYLSEESIGDLAIRYSVSRGAIQLIKTRKTWITVTEDLGEPGSQRPPEARTAAFLTKEEVSTIFTITGRTQASLAREFGVSQATISTIRSGRVWRHVTDGLRAKDEED
jgi:hypothetical protein